MTNLLLPCSKGCGENISVSEDVLEEVKASGMPLDVSHNVCPRDRTVKPLYRIIVNVYRYDNHDLYEQHAHDVPVKLPDAELLATLGTQLESASFNACVDSAINEIDQQLQRLKALAPSLEDGLDNESLNERNTDHGNQTQAD